MKLELKGRIVKGDRSQLPKLYAEFHALAEKVKEGKDLLSMDIEGDHVGIDWVIEKIRDMRKLYDTDNAALLALTFLKDIKDNLETFQQDIRYPLSVADQLICTQQKVLDLEESQVDRLLEEQEKYYNDLDKKLEELRDKMGLGGGSGVDLKFIKEVEVAMDKIIQDGKKIGRQKLSIEVSLRNLGIRRSEEERKLVTQMSREKLDAAFPPLSILPEENEKSKEIYVPNGEL